MIEIHCDESRPELFNSDPYKVNDNYFLLGGIWVPKELKDRTKIEIKKLRETYNVNGEIKWKNVSPSKLEFYLSLINYFFNTPELRFRVIVVEYSKVNLKKYHNSDAELGFYKFYYQLIHHWIEPNQCYSIFLDYKKNKRHDRLQELHRVLSNANCLSDITNVQGIRSQDSVFIQMADVMMGATGYKYHNLQGSYAKLAVIERIEYFLGKPIARTNATEKKFNVFQINLGD